ncbi:MAG: hypothetical protein ACRDIY_13780 [Chloroflexota bacterium]
MYATREAIFPELDQPVRDRWWLRERSRGVWSQFFRDIPRVNLVRVSFGAPWKTRLGSITLSDDHRTTYIQVNGLLRLREVPECVTTVTIAHEMVHYAHGFGSPLPRRYKHPHQGGIVKRELLRRGMGAEYARYDAWVYDCWYDFYAEWLSQEARPTSA